MASASGLSSCTAIPWATLRPHPLQYIQVTSCGCTNARVYVPGAAVTLCPLQHIKMTSRGCIATHTNFSFQTVSGPIESRSDALLLQPFCICETSPGAGASPHPFENMNVSHSGCKISVASGPSTALLHTSHSSFLRCKFIVRLHMFAHSKQTRDPSTTAGYPGAPQRQPSTSFR